MATAAENSSPEAQEARVLARLGYTRAHDILYYLPRAFRDYKRVFTRFSGAPEENSLFRCKVKSIKLQDRFGNEVNYLNPKTGRMAIQLSDEAGEHVSLWLFGGSAFPFKWVKPDETLLLYGRLKRNGTLLKFSLVTKVSEKEVGQIVPLYPGKPGVAGHDTIAAMVRRALPMYPHAVIRAYGELGMTREQVKERLGYTLEPVLIGVHHPPDLETAKNLLKCAREVAALHVIRQAERAGVRHPVPASALAVTARDMTDSERRLEFPLTQDQCTAIAEILDDLSSPFPMNRLLSGDVGTGKTLTYVLPAIAVASQGYRVAVMTPNALLVEQIASQIKTLAPETPVACVTGSLSKKSLPQLQSAMIHVGTTALLSQKFDYRFIVVDEQHKFGRDQRDALRARGTNVLQATATAIPRTMGLLSHGGMDVSYLRECPVQKKITTLLQLPEQKRQMMGALVHVVRNGGQAAVVFAALDKVEAKRGKASKAVADNDGELALEFEERTEPELLPVLPLNDMQGFFEQVFPGRVGILTGGLSEVEKLDVIERMKRREIDVLLTTTVIEIGVTLPDLRIITIMNAERFGVAQIHQLRGRVARHGGQGWCQLYVPGDPGPEALARLTTLTECNDGFRLAEMDMQARGFGNIDADGNEQAGKAVTLFSNLTLMPADIERLSEAIPSLHARMRQ